MEKNQARGNQMLKNLFIRIFRINDLEPIEDWHTNSVLKGVKKGDITVISDLPVTQLGDKLVSIWYAKSFFTRLKFLITGKVNFQIMAPTHAPISISIGEYEQSNNGEEDE